MNPFNLTLGQLVEATVATSAACSIIRSEREGVRLAVFILALQPGDARAKAADDFQELITSGCIVVDASPGRPRGESS